MPSILLTGDVMLGRGVAQAIERFGAPYPWGNVASILQRADLALSSSKREFGFPEHYHIVAPMVLGYPKTWPESQGRNPAEIRWLG